MEIQEIGALHLRRFLELGPLALDSLQSRAFLDGSDLALGEEEFDALYLLAQQKGGALGFEELYHAVWEPPNEADNRPQAMQGLARLAACFAAHETCGLRFCALPDRRFCLEYRPGAAGVPG